MRWKREKGRVKARGKRQKKKVEEIIIDMKYFFLCRHACSSVTDILLLSHSKNMANGRESRRYWQITSQSAQQSHITTCNIFIALFKRNIWFHRRDYSHGSLHLRILRGLCRCWNFWNTQTYIHLIHSSNIWKQKNKSKLQPFFSPLLIPL